MFDLASIERMVQEGAPPRTVIAALHEQGVTIIESMKLVRQLYGCSLAQAKGLVASHPVWDSFVQGNAPLHDALEMLCAERLFSQDESP